MPPIVPIFDVGDYDHQIREGAARLREGGVVVLPTETVYGAAAVISHPQARQRLRALRGGGESKPFTIHIASRDLAQQYLGTVSELGQRMMKKLWPGPVALVFDVPPARQQEVASTLAVPVSDLYDGPMITLRCPDHIVTSDLLSMVSSPVALTLVNANPSLTTAQSNWDVLDGKVDLIFDAGPTRYSKASTIVRVRGEKYEIVREGIYDQRIIERLLRTTLLFVCSGNTCRSPMAEALARKLLAQHLRVREDEIESKGISVISAGSFAMPGARATPQAVDAVKQLGADLSKHRSRPLSVELIHQADFIFAMSRNHAQAIAALVPSAAEKTLPLDPGGDIEDPIGGDASLYVELAKMLEALIKTRLSERQLG